MTHWVAEPALSRRLTDEVLVAAIDPERGAPIRLNPTAVAIWDEVQEASTVAEIAERLEVPVDRATVEADVALLLSQLEGEALVRPAAAGESGPADQTSSEWTGTGRPFPEHGDLWLRLATFDPTVEPAGEGVDLADFGADTSATVEEIERMGSLGQLAHAIDLGHVVATADERSLVQERWAANQMHCLRVEQMLLVALRRLNDAGVPHRLLKGVAVTYLDHPGTSWREFGDADVLVPEADWGAAVAAIDSDPLFRSLFGDVVHPFGEEKGMTFLTPDGLMLDLHKRLNIAGLGAKAVDVLFESEEVFTIGDMEVSALSRPARLVHALLHWFASKPIRRATMRDLVELSDGDAEAVAEIAGELQLTGVVKRSAGLLGRELELPDLLRLAEQLEPTRIERVLAARRGEQSLHRNVLWRELTGVMVTSGIRGRAAYVRRRAFPDGSFRSVRGVSWRTYAEVLSGRRTN